MNIKILQLVLPFRHRSEFWPWFRQFTKLTWILAIFGTGCYLVAGWHLFTAVPVALASATVFMLVGEMLWKAGIVVRALWNASSKGKK